MLGKKEKRTQAAQTDWDHPTDPMCHAVFGTNQGLSKGWGSHGHVNHDNNTDQRATLCFFARSGCCNSHNAQCHGDTVLAWVKGSHSHCCCSPGKPWSAWDQASDVLTQRPEMLPSRK